MYVGSRLVIPRHGNIREELYGLAHDVLGHFGFEKSYGSLKDSYYWPNMRKDLEDAYIPSCEACQQNKSKTHKPTGPLHPNPVPDGRFESITIDFRMVPSHTNITAEQFAVLFFNNWYCEHGLPKDIFSDRDKLFVSKH